MTTPSPTPNRIGNYKILRKLGEGGIGIVYEGQHPQTPELTHAIKVVREGISIVLGKTEAEILGNEAEMNALLQHPGIVKIEQAMTHSTPPHLVMEMIHGKNLAQIIEESGGKLSVEQVQQIFVKILEPIQAAHKEGVVHRDLKPGNVLIDETGKVKITDFGIGKLLAHGQADNSLITTRGIGTPFYMSPEQVDGGQVDERTDIYALGKMLGEMLGRRPHLSSQTLPAGTPKNLQEIWLKCINDDPNQRYASIAQLRKAIGIIPEKKSVSPSAKIKKPHIIQKPQGNEPSQKVIQDVQAEIAQVTDKRWGRMADGVSVLGAILTFANPTGAVAPIIGAIGRILEQIVKGATSLEYGGEYEGLGSQVNSLRERVEQLEQELTKENPSGQRLTETQVRNLFNIPSIAGKIIAEDQEQYDVAQYDCRLQAERGFFAGLWYSWGGQKKKDEDAKFDVQRKKAKKESQMSEKFHAALAKWRKEEEVRVKQDQERVKKEEEERQEKAREERKRAREIEKQAAKQRDEEEKRMKEVEKKKVEEEKKKIEDEKKREEEEKALREFKEEFPGENPEELKKRWEREPFMSALREFALEGSPKLLPVINGRFDLRYAPLDKRVTRTHNRWENISFYGANIFFKNVYNLNIKNCDFRRSNLVMEGESKVENWPIHFSNSDLSNCSLSANGGLLALQECQIRNSKIKINTSIGPSALTMGRVVCLVQTSHFKDSDLSNSCIEGHIVLEGKNNLCSSVVESTLQIIGDKNFDCKHTKYLERSEPGELRRSPTAILRLTCDCEDQGKTKKVEEKLHALTTEEIIELIKKLADASDKKAKEISVMVQTFNLELEGDIEAFSKKVEAVHKLLNELGAIIIQIFRIITEKPKNWRAVRDGVHRLHATIIHAVKAMKVLKVKPSDLINNGNARMLAGATLICREMGLGGTNSGAELLLSLVQVSGFGIAMPESSSANDPTKTIIQENILVHQAAIAGQAEDVVSAMRKALYEGGTSVSQMISNQTINLTKELENIFRAVKQILDQHEGLKCESDKDKEYGKYLLPELVGICARFGDLYAYMATCREVAQNTIAGIPIDDIGDVAEYIHSFPDKLAHINQFMSTEKKRKFDSIEAAQEFLKDEVLPIVGQPKRIETGEFGPCFVIHKKKDPSALQKNVRAAAQEIIIKGEKSLDPNIFDLENLKKLLSDEPNA